MAIVESSGTIITRGEGAAGIAAAGADGAAVIASGNIATEGDEAPGITVISDGEVGVASGGIDHDGRQRFARHLGESLANGTVAVAASGSITTAGDDSDGIWVESDSGLVVVISSANITTTGPDSDGISAVSGHPLARRTTSGS